MEGEVIATGTHKELKESSPEYIQIYKLTKKALSIMNYNLNQISGKTAQTSFESCFAQETDKYYRWRAS